jgi:hypothetical protein
MKRETRKTPTTAKPARGETRFPGIKRHAAALGVTRPHLWMVLTGERQSADLVRRYKELLRSEGRTLFAA